MSRSIAAHRRPHLVGQAQLWMCGYRAKDTDIENMPCPVPGRTEIIGSRMWGRAGVGHGG